MKNIIGLIPARKNSKRVKNKNTKNLGDKPLIAWTIDVARESEVLSDIIVSTDSKCIAEIAIKHGAKVPWLRPNHLAGDLSLTIDVVLNFLDKLEEENNLPDGILVLQPTSPFRSKQTIIDAVKIFSKDTTKSVVSFTKSKIIPEWCFRTQRNKISPLMGWKNLTKRSQDIKEVYELNGLIYLASPQFLRKYKSFLSSSTIPLNIKNQEESLDIDSNRDFEYAEMLLKKFNV